ncbi:hypothetical protein, variant 2 [Aphanomyces astaci]|uniref:MABP domain-containing protein n=1 Tax=Aphanomyces astaci TaxID=112090 RepID=W4H1B9_APHAT|nr:hypothetical protein, variant 2 [Aphanomyces astaci]ETV85810.1 hypothetical protein, variant 2 [Aphanomyces astaci]|eukprot:XP_009824282.1 hypothetical protein, variant 2 [Aphanomyces astaci]
MTLIVVVYAGIEYDLEVDANDTAAVLCFQLYSLLGVDVDSQVLVTSTGHKVTLDDTIASLTASAPWLLLLDSTTPSSCFNPSIDSDWKDICTRLVAPNIPLAQPAYNLHGMAICQPCATTCVSTSGSFIEAVENTADTRDHIRQSFICDLAVVVGAADVPAPLGFTKLNVDLNHTASGPFVFLCYKRGGNRRPVSHVKVVHGLPTAPPQVDGYEVLPVNLNHGTISSIGIYLCVRRLAADAWRQLSGLALHDLHVSSSRDPGAFVLSQVDLNGGNDGTTPLFLRYKLNPVAGFVCGKHGECLFEPRVTGGHESATSWTHLTSQQQIVAAQHIDATLRRSWNATAAIHFEREEARLKQMLAGQLHNTLKYERQDYQAQALAAIPLARLHERARANPTPQPTFEIEVLRQLITWFKHEFFSWMNAPACRVCGAPDTLSIRQEGPVTPEEIAGEAGRVEVYECRLCQAITRFPRYNDPTKLLQTRTGRCGEWANCFTLCCRALGYDARYVHDFTDHVWTEVYSSHHERWLHCDPCEDQLDCPLTYEVGWGKHLTYIFATSVDEIVDVARRYTRDYDAMLERRTMAREPSLLRILSDLNATKTHAPDRKLILATRAAAEAVELAAVKEAKTHETVGRVSGSKEWRDARVESGNASGSAEPPPTSVVSSTLTTGAASVLDVNQELRSLLQRMLQGKGCSFADSCVNPFCLHSHVKAPGFDLTSYSATSIQSIVHLQDASAQGLTALTCSEPGSFQSSLLALPLALYWPLQDHVSALVVDASGRGRHGINVNCPVQKPFAVKFSRFNTGLQLVPLTPPRSLSSGVSTSTSWTLQWLLRWHDQAVEALRPPNAAPSTPFLHLSPSPDQPLLFHLAYTDALTLEWLGPPDTTAAGSSASDSLAVDTTYHMALVSASGVVTCFVNGVAVFETRPLTTNPIQLASFEFAVAPSPRSSVLPLLSHVALVTRALSAEELHALARAAVPSPRLVAGGADDFVDPSVTCLESVASEDSGHRVLAVHLWSGDFFDGVQLTYANTSTGVVTPGRAWATTTAAGATKQTLQLLEDEFIVQVRGRRGAWMDQMSVTTNFGRSLTAGGTGGGPFDVFIPAGYMVRAFSFDIGDHVNQPVVFSCPAPRGI